MENLSTAIKNATIFNHDNGEADGVHPAPAD